MFLLRSYFELKDEENFLRQCVGAKKYYKSQNLSKTKEAYFFDAIDIMKDLFFVNNPNKLLKIEDKIQQNEIAVKRWLLKKIKESPFYSKSELLKTK